MTDITARIARIEELDKLSAGKCHLNFVSQAPEMLSIIRELKAENEALKQAVVILPHGAEPEFGDIVEEKFNQQNMLAGTDINYESFYYKHPNSEYKIIQRHGLPVIYQSALEPKQEVK